MHKIVNASIGKRALAALMDLVILLFVALGVFALCQTIFISTEQSKTLVNRINSYQTGSGLYYLDANGNACAYDSFVSYKQYEGILTNYYTVYLKEKAPEEYRKNYDIYWYNVHVLGLKDEKNLYADDSILEPGLSSTLWRYKTDGDNKLYDTLGVPACLEEGEDENDLTETEKAALLHFYYNSDSINAYYNAARDLYYSDYFQKDFGEYQKISTIYPLVIAVASSSLAVYLLVPLLLQDGATLGKKMFGFGLVTKNGFAVKRGQIVLRQLPSILAVILIFYFVSFIYAVMFVSLGMFLSYMLALFTKGHRAAHDYVGFTEVVDLKESLFFSDLATQEAAESSYKKAMEEADRIKSVGEEELKREQMPPSS